MSPFFFHDYIHNTVVYSLSLQVSGSFFFSVLNKCSPLARTSAITVCFSLAKLGGSHQQPSRSAAPPASAERWRGFMLKRTRRSFKLLRNRGTALQVSPHHYHHQSVRAPPPLPPQPHHILCMEVKRSAARSHCYLHGLWVMLKSA